MCLITENLVTVRLAVLAADVKCWEDEGELAQAALVAQERLELQRWWLHHRESCNASH